jgi:membrane-associated phospholipid phosphatase
LISKIRLSRERDPLYFSIDLFVKPPYEFVIRLCQDLSYNSVSFNQGDMDFMKRCFFYAFLALGIFLSKAGSAFDYSLVPVRNLSAEGLANIQPQGLTEGQAKTLENEMAMAASEPNETLKPIGSGSFLGNLAGNFVGLFSMTNLPPLMAGSVMTGASHGFDQSVNDYILKHQQTAWGNIGDFLGSPEFVIPVIGTFYMFGRHSQNTKFRCMTYSLVQGYILVTGIDYVIKFGVGRERPDKSDHQSFVSGHAATSFMWAGILSHYYGHKAAYPAYLAAFFISIARLEGNVHWLSDILGGATVGYIIGNTVARRMDLLNPENRYSISPMVGPNGHGMGMAVKINL